MEETHRKINVVFEQYVIPHYRVPFFERLAQKTNLLVVASEGVEVDGVADIKKDLPFKTLRLKENPSGSGFHEEIFSILSEHKADVYVSYGALLNYMLSRPLLWKNIKTSGAKIFWMGCDGYWARNFLLEKFVRFKPWNPKGFFRALRESLVVSRTDGFICHSTHMANYFKIVHGVSEKKITLAHNAIDTSRLVERYQDLFRRGVPKKPQELIFVGRLTSGKRVDVLLKAFSYVSQQYPGAFLKIVGEGSERENLENLAKSLGLTHRVHFLGGIYDEDLLAEQMYTASLYVLPGLGGLGLNTAMAMGLPIVCTYADGTEEDLVVNGYNGWRFDGSEKGLVKALKNSLSNQERLEDMGKKSFDLIKNRYNLENMVQGYVEAFTKIF